MYLPSESDVRLSVSGATSGGIAIVLLLVPRSYVNRDHLQFFHFIGRVVGKARHTRFQAPCGRPSMTGRTWRLGSLGASTSTCSAGRLELRKRPWETATMKGLKIRA